MPKLVLIAKGKARTIEMGQELTIGRGYSNLLRLDGEEISRVHAIIYRRNNDFVIRDLDSKNGVFVNGSKVACVELGRGDKLQVGKYQMVFDPPSDFDINKMAESPSSSQTSSSNGTNGSGGGAHISDAEFSHSQLFRSPTPAANPVHVPEELPEPEICREEVLIFTRQELNERLEQSNSTLIQKAADYTDEFFAALLHGESPEGADGFSGLVMRSLVKALSADRGVVIIRDVVTNELSPSAIVAANDDVAVNRVVLRSGFTEGKAILCPSTADCGLFRDSTTVSRDRISSLISVPLGTTEILGLIYLDRQGEVDGFNPAHLFAAARVARLLEAHMVDLHDKLRKNRN